jgi:hypothetical protein
MRITPCLQSAKSYLPVPTCTCLHLTLPLRCHGAGARTSCAGGVPRHHQRGQLWHPRWTAAPVQSPQWLQPPACKKLPSPWRKLPPPRTQQVLPGARWPAASVLSTPRVASPLHLPLCDVPAPPDLRPACRFSAHLLAPYLLRHKALHSAGHQLIHRWPQPSLEHITTHKPPTLHSTCAGRLLPHGVPPCCEARRVTGTLRSSFQHPDTGTCTHITCASPA